MHWKQSAEVFDLYIAIVDLFIDYIFKEPWSVVEGNF